jgi:protein O-mannosyl-transferase
MNNKSNGFGLNTESQFHIERKYFFAFTTLFFTLFIIYVNSYNGGWYLDDEPNIVYNRNVQLEALNWENLKKTFYGIDQKKIVRPLSYLSFGLNYYFGKLDTLHYHIVNLLIHYLSSIFLFLFVLRTLNLPLLVNKYGSSSYSIALLAAFFWAINPVHVTAVTYIVQRMASMAGLFYIVSMYCYLCGRTNEIQWRRIAFYILCFLSMLSAIGTKENAIMLPLILYLYDLFLIQGIKKENLLTGCKYLILPVLFALFIMFFFIDISSVTGDFSIRPFSIMERVLTETRVILFYISLLLYPIYSRLMLNHDFIISRSLLDPYTTMAAVLIIFILMGFAAFNAKKNPLIAFCIFFFFLNHFIEGSFLSLELVFEHRNYIPSMLFFLPIAIFIMRACDYFSQNTTILIMIIVLLSSIITAQGHTVSMYNFLFKDPYLLWVDNIKKAPNLSRPYNNLGNILWNRGFYDEACISYKKSFELNRSDLLPMIAAPIHNIGRCCFRNKDYVEAMYYFKEAIRINPGYQPTWFNLTKAQIQMKDFTGAEKTIHQIPHSGRKTSTGHGLLSFIFLKKGKYKESIKEAWKTLTIDNESSDVLRVVAEAYSRSGNYERAVFFWERYLLKYNNDIEGHLALIDLYAKTKEKTKLLIIISKLMVLKDTKSWQEFFQEYEMNQASNVYVLKKKILLSVIHKNLNDQFR